MIQARLKDIPFFSSISKKELGIVAQQTDEVDVPAGKVLAREGDLGDEFFGEMALLDADRRNATVTATSPMSLIVMTRASFRTLNRSQPAVHETVAKAIAVRHAEVT
jgi:CRP-like cAMP-binding protein